MRAGNWIALGLLSLALAAGTGWLLQRQEIGALERERVLLREERATLEKLKLKYARLQATRATPEEIERLRADREALVRLRAEIEAMKQRVAAREGK